MNNIAELTNTTDINALYSSFNQARLQLYLLEPIDYFFAKEIYSSLNKEQVQDSRPQLFFHLFVALSESLRNGHTCLPLINIAGQRFGFNSDDDELITHNGYIFPVIDQLTAAVEQLNIGVERKALIVHHNGALYVRRYYQFESELAGFMREKLVSKALIITEDNEQEHTTTQLIAQSNYIEQIEKCMATLFPADNADATDVGDIDWQKVAVANAINKDFSIIAGGPGTGKTYTVIKLLAALLMIESSGGNKDNDKLIGALISANNTDGDTNSGSNSYTKKSALRIALVAPTGKAAQRLSESIIKAISGFRGQIDDDILNALPTHAQTLHRLLGVIPNNPNFRHHQDNLLAIDILLIDEVSMVDLALMTRTFRALPRHTKVILLGDADQLPSVAAGSVLGDIAQRPHGGFSKENVKYLAKVTGCDLLTPAKKMPADHVVFLRKSRRFDGQGGIGRLAKTVIEGESQLSWQLLSEPLAQLELLDNDLAMWLPSLVDTYFAPLFDCKEVSHAFRLLSRFRVLCATRQGEYGVETINEKIKYLLLNKGLIQSIHALYQAQPIMISENDYRLGLFNGDTGILWRNQSGHLMAVFEDANKDSVVASGNFKWFMPSRLPKFTTVYAMTIHKTQGSEFDHVAMVLPKNSDNKLLSRELLYTGITRAKSLLSIASSANVWRHGVEAKVTRYSGLKIN